MKVSRKILGVFFLGMLVVTLFSVFNAIFSGVLMSKGQDTVENEVTNSIRQTTEEELKELSGNIGGYELSFEAEIDRTMLTAVNLLYEKDVDRGFRMSDAELERLLEVTGMNDLYISDENGIFTQTTEEAGLGLCLFDIWDGYRMLVTGESDCLPSPMKIKEETGEIFKFTAIPRQDRRGTLQSALNADAIQDKLQQFITDSNGISSMYFIDLNNTVLTENLAKGASSLYTKGSTISNQFVDAIQNGSNSIHIEYDGENKADVYAPVNENGTLKYVLILNVDLSGYYLVADIMDQPLSSMIGNVNIAGTILAGIVLAVSAISLIISGVVLMKMFRPIKSISVMAADLTEGKLDTPDIIANGNDEICQVAFSLNTMKKELSTYINNISKALGKMKEGDFRYKNMASFKGDFTAIENSLTAISSSMTEMIQQISSSSAQVNNDAAAISQSAHSVANNAERQVAEVGMLSDKIRDIAENIRTNASDASDALECSMQASDKLEKQNQSIKEMTAAMREIEKCSSEISTVIKAIEDISFQTNILALNAAVEASRAGEAGKGFSVVADEVRNLASKSAEAAGSTSKLIKATVDAVNAGVATADGVAKAMGEVMELSSKTNSAVKNISYATDMQNEAVQDIRGSIDNISGVIQENSTAAGESAEISGRLREEADELKERMTRFTVN